MKDKIVYAVIFLFLFALVSAGLVFVNGMYNNIFKFDFSPIQPPKPLLAKKPLPEPAAVTDSTKKDSTATPMDSLKMLADSISYAKANPPKVDSKTGTDKSKGAENKTLAAEKGKTQTEKQTQLDDKKAALAQAQIANQIEDKRQKAKKDSIYTSWIKQTVKLYESMDSKKAAKVIQGYSDNIARDILLKMKKKKAAEILAELKPEVVTRIISVN